MSERLSARGASLNASFEGIYLYAYPDPGSGGDPITIGIGHTRYSGKPHPRLGDRISLQTAIELFKRHAVKYEQGVVRALGDKLPQHQFDAAFMLHYNTGSIRKGTVDDKIRRGDEEAALATWLRYNRAAGKVMRGLKIRRAAEVRLWRTGDYGDRKILVKDSPKSKGRLLRMDAIDWDHQEPPKTITADVPAPPPLPTQKPKGNFIIDISRFIWRILK